MIESAGKLSKRIVNMFVKSIVCSAFSFHFRLLQVIQLLLARLRMFEAFLNNYFMQKGVKLKKKEYLKQRRALWVLLVCPPRVRVGHVDVVGGLDEGEEGDQHGEGEKGQPL